jgi:hypothetical protein
MAPNRVAMFTIYVMHKIVGHSMAIGEVRPLEISGAYVVAK